MVEHKCNIYLLVSCDFHRHTFVKNGNTYWVKRLSTPVTYQLVEQSTQVPTQPTQTPTEAPTTTSVAEPNSWPTVSVNLQPFSKQKKNKVQIC